jgi:hypothetical protein
MAPSAAELCRLPIADDICLKGLIQEDQVGSSLIALDLDCEDGHFVPQIIGTCTATGDGIALPNSVQPLVCLEDGTGANAVGIYESVVEQRPQLKQSDGKTYEVPSP